MKLVNIILSILGILAYSLTFLMSLLYNDILDFQNLCESLGEAMIRFLVIPSILVPILFIAAAVKLFMRRKFGFSKRSILIIWVTHLVLPILFLLLLQYYRSCDGLLVISYGTLSFISICVLVFDLSKHKATYKPDEQEDILDADVEG